MVSPKKDNYKALKEICEQHHVERLDLHNSSVTGEDAPDRQSELNLLVELLPISENESLKVLPALEQALAELFGRPISLLRTDDLKPDYLREIVTRRRTLLYPAQDRAKS